MADAAELRRFATEQFEEYIYGFPKGVSPFQLPNVAFDDLPQYLKVSVRLLVGRGRQDFLDLAARSIEAFGWHRLGHGLDYFDDRVPIKNDVNDVITALEKFVSGPNSSFWPQPFHNLAQQILLDRSRDLIQGSPTDIFRVDDLDGMATFQSALVAAKQFRDPLVENLSYYLNAMEPADEPTQPTARGILLALDGPEARESIKVSSSETLVAGIVRLIECLSSFETIFPPLEVDSEVYSTRLEIGFFVTRLLSWRLDLWDARKVKKLQQLIDQFWWSCSEQFPINAVDMEFDVGAATIALSSLLNRWRNRAEIDPSTRPALL